jgi:hypothetical protein
MARAGWNKAKKTYSLNRVISELKRIYTSFDKENVLGTTDKQEM